VLAGAKNNNNNNDITEQFNMRTADKHEGCLPSSSKVHVVHLQMQSLSLTASCVHVQCVAKKYPLTFFAIFLTTAWNFDGIFYAFINYLSRHTYK